MVFSPSSCLNSQHIDNQNFFALSFQSELISWMNSKENRPNFTSFLRMKERCEVLLATHDLNQELSLSLKHNLYLCEWITFNKADGVREELIKVMDSANKANDLSIQILNQSLQESKIFKTNQLNEKESFFLGWAQYQLDSSLIYKLTHEQTDPLLITDLCNIHNSIIKTLLKLNYPINERKKISYQNRLSNDIEMLKLIKATELSTIQNSSFRLIRGLNHDIAKQLDRFLNIEILPVKVTKAEFNPEHLKNFLATKHALSVMKSYYNDLLQNFDKPKNEEDFQLFNQLSELIIKKELQKKQKLLLKKEVLKSKLEFLDEKSKQTLSPDEKIECQRNIDLIQEQLNTIENKLVSFESNKNVNPFTFTSIDNIDNELAIFFDECLKFKTDVKKEIKERYYKLKHEDKLNDNTLLAFLVVYYIKEYDVEIDIRDLFENVNSINCNEKEKEVLEEIANRNPDPKLNAKNIIFARFIHQKLEIEENRASRFLETLLESSLNPQQIEKDKKYIETWLSTTKNANVINILTIALENLKLRS